MNEPLNLAEDPRAGLEVIRYHTWAVHRQQSNGEHSCQIMRILLTIWPDCPRKMLVHSVLHDIGEMAGDAQYPFKKTISGMKKAHDDAEEAVRCRMQLVFFIPDDVVLSEHEKNVFKICEWIEMYEYGLRETNMGNRYGQVVAMRSLLEMNRFVEDMKIPPGAPDVRPAIKRYVDTRAKWELTSD